MQNLTKIDNVIFKKIADMIYENNNIYFYIEYDKLIEQLKEYNISNQDINESLGVLKDKYLINTKGIPSNEYQIIFITPYGFYEYSRNYIENFKNIEKDIIAYILNNEPQDNIEVTHALSHKKIIIDSLILYYGEKGYFEVHPLHAKEVYIKFFIKNSGKRYLKEIINS